jgi:hypothetical protein
MEVAEKELGRVKTCYLSLFSESSIGMQETNRRARDAAHLVVGSHAAHGIQWSSDSLSFRSSLFRGLSPVQS